jgi:hypothetical protein
MTREQIIDLEQQVIELDEKMRNFRTEFKFGIHTPTFVQDNYDYLGTLRVNLGVVHTNVFRLLIDLADAGVGDV